MERELGQGVGQHRGERHTTGGHILNNVYGANESTDVGDFGIADAAYTALHPEVHVGDLYCKNGGTATVKISGGTIGMPFSADDFSSRPLFGNVFGGGAGDPRRIFNVHTNVNNTDVQITGGTIYGSVFGGTEQGHVVNGTSVSINEAVGKTVVIGTSGFSGYDGHVFGGGKGDETNYDPYLKVEATDPDDEKPTTISIRLTTIPIRRLRRIPTLPVAVWVATRVSQ